MLSCKAIQPGFNSSASFKVNSMSVIAFEIHFKKEKKKKHEHFFNTALDLKRRRQTQEKPGRVQVVTGCV